MSEETETQDGKHQFVPSKIHNPEQMGEKDGKGESDEKERREAASSSQQSEPSRQSVSLQQPAPSRQPVPSQQSEPSRQSAPAQNTSNPHFHMPPESFIKAPLPGSQCQQGTPQGYYNGPPNQPWHPPVHQRQGGMSQLYWLFWLGGVLTLMTFITMEVGSLLWNFYASYDQVLASSTTMYVPIPYVVEVGELHGGWFLAWYVFLVCAILASLVHLALRSGIGDLKKLGRAIYRMEPPSIGTRQPYMVIFQIFMANLCFATVYALIIIGAGITPASPLSGGGISWKLPYALANAAVYEELWFRMLYVGVPIALLGTAKGARGIDSVRPIFGNVETIGTGHVVIVIISSIGFGLAHVPGWDMYKLLPSTLAGLFIGYIFLRVGLSGAIVFHFMIDYLATLVPVLNPAVNVDSLPVNDLILIMVIGLFVLFWAVFGAVYLVNYAKMGIAHFISLFKDETSEECSEDIQAP